jgi:hypothetical protein
MYAFILIRFSLPPSFGVCYNRLKQKREVAFMVRVLVSDTDIRTSHSPEIAGIPTSTSIGSMEIL